MPARFAPALILALAWAAPALAEEDRQTFPHGVWGLTVENDIIAGTDRDYTNGILLTYVGPENDLPLVGRAARDNLGWLTSATSWRMTYGLGQNMYTPEDITRRAPDPDDRPYAGFLYGSVGVAADKRVNQEPVQLDVLALDVGLVGQESLAEQAQKTVHKLIDSDDPKGWGSQLGTEVAFRLLYERTWRASRVLEFKELDLEIDVTPRAGFALGTAETYGAFGAAFRIGDALPNDYGPPRVRPALASPGFFEDAKGFAWYLFAGAEGRLFARDMFIEGNTFKDSAGVDLRPVQVDLQFGVAFQVEDFELAFTHVIRSPQHDRQDRWSRFGSVSIRKRF